MFCKVIFDNLINYAIQYFNDVIKQQKKYKKPNSEEKSPTSSFQQFGS